ncbi:MAG TPA: DUF4040 domain-containing protein [Chloroflexi bacterium]|nr:DUF4040 domain-containing protein [Chloroflexota bacterium]
MRRRTVIGLVYSFLALTALGAAIVTLTTRSLTWSVVALGIGSASLAMMFFLLGAPYAAGFELSVGTGLISILLIIGISLTKSRRASHP